MKKKISITMCLMTAVSVIITAVMISLVIYRKNYNEMKSMIKAEAEYISQAIDTEDINYLESVKNVTPSRITWIDSNGNVIYDSAGENLSNHSDRPEIIDAVKNGAEAVEKIAASVPGEYALVLMDIQMPHMNGYEATKAIHGGRNPLGKTIPIIAMTANAFTEDRQVALDAGMNDHIAKPINMNVLVPTLRKYL